MAFNFLFSALDAADTGLERPANATYTNPAVGTLPQLPDYLLCKVSNWQEAFDCGGIVLTRPLSGVPTNLMPSTIAPNLCHVFAGETLRDVMIRNAASEHVPTAYNDLNPVPTVWEEFFEDPDSGEAPRAYNAYLRESAVGASGVMPTTSHSISLFPAKSGSVEFTLPVAQLSGSKVARLRRAKQTSFSYPDLTPGASQTDTRVGSFISNDVLGEMVDVEAIPFFHKDNPAMDIFEGVDGDHTITVWGLITNATGGRIIAGNGALYTDKVLTSDVRALIVPQRSKIIAGYKKPQAIAAAEAVFDSILAQPRYDEKMLISIATEFVNGRAQVVNKVPIVYRKVQRVQLTGAAEPEGYESTPNLFYSTAYGEPLGQFELVKKSQIVSISADNGFKGFAKELVGNCSLVYAAGPVSYYAAGGSVVSHTPRAALQEINSDNARYFTSAFYSAADSELNHYRALQVPAVAFSNTWTDHPLVPRRSYLETLKQHLHDSLLTENELMIAQPDILSQGAGLSDDDFLATFGISREVAEEGNTPTVLPIKANFHHSVFTRSNVPQIISDFTVELDNAVIDAVS